MNRILLVGMPRLLVDILLPIVGSELDMSVVGRVEHNDLAAAARRTQADVVVIGEGAREDREEREQEYRRLLLEFPHLKLLTISDDARSAALYELCPRRVPLGEVSAYALRNAIRGDPSTHSVN